MLIAFLSVAVAGVLAGVLTGITPGLHPNTILFSSLPFFFSSGIELPVYVVFVSSLSISHTFHDFLPALFLAPMDSETALASLPGAGLVSEGEGLRAFRSTVRGGVYGMLTVLLFFPVLLNFLPAIYSFLESVMFELVLFFLLFSILYSSSVFRGSMIAILAGMLGILAFQSPINQNFVLTPVFTGLFTLPSLMNISRPSGQQSGSASREKTVRGGLVGSIAGMVSGVVPGVGAATSTTLLSPLIDDEEEFMAGMGAVNSTDIFVSLFTLHLVQKARNGPAVVLQATGQIDAPLLVFAAGIVLFSASLSVPIAITFSGYYVDLIDSFPPRYFTYLLIPLVFLINLLMTGWQGILIFFTAGFIGYAAFISDQRRATMAVLMVPVLASYSGII